MSKERKSWDQILSKEERAMPKTTTSEAAFWTILVVVIITLVVVGIWLWHGKGLHGGGDVPNGPKTVNSLRRAMRPQESVPLADAFGNQDDVPDDMFEQKNKKTKAEMRSLLDAAPRDRMINEGNNEPSRILGEKNLYSVLFPAPAHKISKSDVPQWGISEAYSSAVHGD